VEETKYLNMENIRKNFRRVCMLVVVFLDGVLAEKRYWN
jgi:hypothetical protein